MKCGNPLHPDGAWHDATPLPLYVSRLTGWLSKAGREARQAEKRYERNTREWGCGCDYVALPLDPKDMP